MAIPCLGEVDISLIGPIIGGGTDLFLRNALMGQKFQPLVMGHYHIIGLRLIMDLKKIRMVVGQKAGRVFQIAILHDHGCHWWILGDVATIMMFAMGHVVKSDLSAIII
jgi:hypothetical protein